MKQKSEQKQKQTKNTQKPQNKKDTREPWEIKRDMLQEKWGNFTPAIG